jgi:N-acetylglucosamine repressor
LLKMKNVTRTGSQQLIKEINQVLIFKTIREIGPVSRSQLAKELSLSPTTVTVIVDYFMENGFLIETGKGDSSGGRKPILVKLAPQAGVVVAVDLEQHRVAVLNMEAQILLENKLPPFRNKEELVSSLMSVIDALINECRVQHEIRPLGIGIAVPGIIDSQKGKVVTSSSLNFNHLSLKEELQEHFQVPVLLENDANSAAYGEFLYGRAQQVQNFLYIHAGRAVGAGFFLSGSLFTGGAGGAGEFGHISVDESGPVCHCGNIGCLGKLISVQALSEIWRERNGKAEFPALTELVQLSNKGEETAARLMDYAGEMLGRGIVTLVHLFNPTLILLGGELALNNTRLLNQVKNHVDRRTLQVFSKHVKIEESLTKLNAGIIGAGSLALHHFFEHLDMDAVMRR